MLLFLKFPAWIHPEVIKGLPIRWYGLMYLVAIIFTYLLMKKQISDDNIEIQKDDIESFFMYCIIGAILGARLFGTLVYGPTMSYLKAPWKIIWPFVNGQFVGLAGMSYHGGILGVAIALIIFGKKKNKDILLYGDLLSVSFPLGYTFGRLGNFINGELWGKITTSKIGIIFPNATLLDTNKKWVQEIAGKIGMNYEINSYINLPRHPSQLYEAIFEGIILWVILWYFIKPRKKIKGTMIGFYVIGYGAFRFFIEYFREPDSQIGYILKLSETNTPISIFSSLLNFSLGQFFCLLMIIIGIIYIYLCKNIAKR